MLTNLCLWKPEDGKRNIGRPKRTWQDTLKKSGGDGHRLERQDDCCQRSCQLGMNHRPMFRTKLEELSLIKSLSAYDTACNQKWLDLSKNHKNCPLFSDAILMMFFWKTVKRFRSYSSPLPQTPFLILDVHRHYNSDAMINTTRKL